MDQILSVLLPLFTVIIIGYIASFSKRFETAATPINSLVFNIALPALLFMAVLRGTPLQNFPPLYPIVILITLVSTSLFLFAIILWGRKENARRAAKVAMGGAYGNVVYFGLPIALGILGPMAGITVGIAQMVHNLFYMILYPIVVSALPDGPKVSFWHVFKRALLFNPVAMSIILGLAYGYSGLPMPDLVSGPLDLLGQIATPGALFCIGLTFRNSFHAFKGGSIKTLDLVITTVSKLLLLPIVTIVTLKVFFPDMPEVWAATLVILSTMPTSTTAYLASEEYDEDASLLAATVVSTSLLSVLTIPIFLLLL